jgi:Protein of unknown function (DUF732)
MMGRLCRCSPFPGITILVASVAVLIGLAIPAYGDPTSQDANFLAALDKAGISYGSPDQAIAAGNAVCQLLSEGKSAAEAAWQLVITNPGLTSDTATEFAGIAASVYCPQYFKNGSGKSAP